LQEINAGSFLLLAAGPVIGRLAMVALAYRSSYPRLAGTGQAFVGKVSALDFVLAGLFVLPVFAGGWPGLAAIALALVSAGWLRNKANAKLGGITGDVLGAACEMAEACAWLAMVICLGIVRPGG
jgi:adenosylcobinamide-GDP ribazoletransferase